MVKYLGVLLLVAGVVNLARADEAAESALIKKKAQQIGEALQKEDYVVLVNLTYPKVVEMLGGKEKMVAALKTGIKSMKDQGIAFSSLVVAEPGKRASKGKNTFVIVPTTTEMTVPVGKIVVKSYLLGISPDSGKTWTFIDGNGLSTPEKRDQILPEMPEGFQLPEPQKPEIIKDKQ